MVPPYHASLGIIRGYYPDWCNPGCHFIEALFTQHIKSLQLMQNCATMYCKYYQLYKSCMHYVHVLLFWARYIHLMAYSHTSCTVYKVVFVLLCLLWFILNLGWPRFNMNHNRGTKICLQSLPWSMLFRLWNHAPSFGYTYIIDSL